MGILPSGDPKSQPLREVDYPSPVEKGKETSSAEHVSIYVIDERNPLKGVTHQVFIEKKVSQKIYGMSF